jgi:2-dehydro-3-deoxy-D-arabinonate dehydratase
MEFIRFIADGKSSPRVGVLEDGMIRELAIGTLGELLACPLTEIRRLVETRGDQQTARDRVTLLPPIDGRMEVWAAGVTYERSREARMEESNEADVYQRVYDAERPELFYKAAPWRVVTDGEPIGVRRDSALNVPEAELAVIANADAEVVGYAIANDVSSRSIEGENPLYLPQAKVYAGSFALSPGIRPTWDFEARDLLVGLSVERSGRTEWSGHTSTTNLRRTPAQLLECLYREAHFPEGVVLSTGTGIVPELEFNLEPGDLVRISIDGLGELRNFVVEGKDGLAWLIDRSEPRSSEVTHA